MNGFTGRVTLSSGDLLASDFPTQEVPLKAGIPKVEIGTATVVGKGDHFEIQAEVTDPEWMAAITESQPGEYSLDLKPIDDVLTCVVNAVPYHSRISPTND